LRSGAGFTAASFIGNTSQACREQPIILANWITRYNVNGGVSAPKNQGVSGKPILRETDWTIHASI
jgi:hypothetical protein